MEKTPTLEVKSPRLPLPSWSVIVGAALWAKPRSNPPGFDRRSRPMRTLIGWIGLLLVLACLATPAEADRMRPLNGDRSSFMVAPARPHLRFHGARIGHDRSFVSRRAIRGQAFTRQVVVVNPGPVPPLTGTIVPRFSVGRTVHTTIVGLDNRLFIRKHRFAFGTFHGHDKRHHFRRFHGGFPVETVLLLNAIDFPDRVEVSRDMDVDPGTLIVLVTPPSAPAQKVARSTGPTWRSGRSVLTGTLERPQITFVSPVRDSKEVRIFAPSSEQDKANAPPPPTVEGPAH